MKTEAPPLPHWDMSVIFSGLDSKEYEAEFARLKSELASLIELFDRVPVRGGTGREVDDKLIADVEEVITRYNTFREELDTLKAYVVAFVETDTRDQLAQGKYSEFKMEFVDVLNLKTRLDAWLGSFDTQKLIEKSEVAEAHAYTLAKAEIAAKHQMSEAEEDLATSLAITGRHAWGELHGMMSSQIEVAVEMPGGGTELLPMSVVRGLAHDADPAKREAAHHAEVASWRRIEVPLASALNSIKGEVNELNKRRGWDSALDEALCRANMDRETLDAMHTACVESFPDFRRYLSVKARLLGKETLAFWDLFAPVGDPSTAKTWPYDEGTQFIVEQFGSYSDRLSGLAKRSFDENWIDAEPRLGKVGGAFCMGLRKDESRILANYEGSFDSVHTLAHELGHAYHNLCLAERTYLQQITPMTLAETASIFCQTIITNAVLRDADEDEELRIIEADLQDGCQLVVDIHSRFFFESEVFGKRLKRTLSPQEFCDLMIDCQKRTYGEGLNEDELHPYMWAVKGHYYGSSFYNFPYTFGFLFGLGLYARYEADPEGFKAGYDDLLSSTGLADAKTLTAKFGVDIADPGFWRASLDLSRKRIARFEELVSKKTAG